MSDSDISNDSEKNEAIIAALKERIHTLENPIVVQLKKIVSDENRDKFYDDMHKFNKKDIISEFAKKKVSLQNPGPDIDPDKFDFVCVSEEKIKTQICKLERSQARALERAHE